jgi:hypothetical protein
LSKENLNQPVKFLRLFHGNQVTAFRNFHERYRRKMRMNVLHKAPGHGVVCSSDQQHRGLDTLQLVNIRRISTLPEQLAYRLEIDKALDGFQRLEVALSLDPESIQSVGCSMMAK